MANRRYGAHRILSFLSKLKLSLKMVSNGVVELFIILPRELKVDLKNERMECFLL